MTVLIGKNAACPAQVAIKGFKGVLAKQTTKTQKIALKRNTNLARMMLA
jgi:hypothetical protein